jgi:hypothetical protein
MLEAYMNLKELKTIIEVSKKPKREKFLNQLLFEGKNQSSPKFQAHMALKRLKVT